MVAVNKEQTFQQVGSISVGPSDREVVVGSFSMEEGDDAIWFRVTQTSPIQVFRYAFGLLTWRTSFGKELGTEKVYGDTLGEVFRLGHGLAPLEKTGQVIFTPRAYNRAWIAASDPPVWTLNVEAQSGVMVSPGVPAQVFGSASNGMVDTADTGISLVRVNFQ